MKKQTAYLYCIVFLVLVGVAVLFRSVQNTTHIFPASASSEISIAPEQIDLVEYSSSHADNMIVQVVPSHSDRGEIGISSDPIPSQAVDVLAPAHEPEASSENTPRPKRNTLRIHVTDAEGNPISELSVWIITEGSQGFIGRTDENGDAFWKRANAGEWKVVLKEMFKVCETQEYMIQVTEQFTPVELIWDYANPGDLPLPIYSSAAMQFLDQDNLPVGDLDVTVGIVTLGKEGNIEMALLLGPTDEKGEVTWINPEIGTHGMYVFQHKPDEPFRSDITITDQETQKFTFILKDPIVKD